MPVPTPVEVIEIAYTANPPGQVGPRPRVLRAGTPFQIIGTEPGSVEIEFKGSSPLADGTLTVPGGTTVQADVPGHYKFKCTFRRPGHPDVVVDPDNPGVPGGGEMQVLPGD